MRTNTLRGLLLSATLTLASAAIAQTAGQDMKNAGHDTADATRQVAHKTSNGTKKAYHKTANGTQKAYHKTVNGTKTAGQEVGHDTKVGVQKTGHGLHKLGDKISGNPQ